MAFGINDSGEIIGETGDIQAGAIQGFVYSSGAYTLVNYPGATYTVLTGIDDYGVAAGYHSYYNTVDEYYLTAGFLFDHGTYRAVPLPQLGSNAQVQITGISNGGVLYGLEAEAGRLRRHPHRDPNETEEQLQQTAERNVVNTVLFRQAMELWDFEIEKPRSIPSSSA